MFKSARLRLTIIYCAVFFVVFWTFTLGLYFWMDNSFGEGYISQVKGRQTEQSGEFDFNDKSVETVTIAGDVAMGRLEWVLLILNGGMLLVIPPLAWMLTGRTLRPIETMYDRQEQFVSDASHELRTPLTVIQGELDVALKKERSPREYQRVLDSARQELGGLHELVEALLLETRAGEGKAMLAQDEVDIIDLLTETIERMSPLTVAKSGSLEFDPPTTRLVVRGSSIMLGRLFGNVIDNAVKAIDSGGHILVTAEAQGVHVLVTVSDDGHGMTQEAVAHSFDRFYQADDARARQGFGLGLAISKTIVEQHRGTITLTSEPGRGTLVSIKLPRKVST
jgi:signal transduction histidine kinase